MENHVSIWLSQEGVGRGSVQEHAVVAVEELLDGFGAVGAGVVDDAVQFEVGGHQRVELGEERHEVL